MKRLPITTLSHFVIGYMILAFGWWSFHLWKQNNRVFERDKTIVALRYPNQDPLYIEDYKIAQKNWESGRRMVIAEGLFFTICLVWGLWVIRRSASREVSLARQRRNFLLSITHELKSPIASLRLALETGAQTHPYPRTTDPTALQWTQGCRSTSKSGGKFAACSSFGRQLAPAA
jgi:two-component system phosphate regulon sensor histidine kinase PhoR